MDSVLVTGLSGMVGTRFYAIFGAQYRLVNIDLTNGVDITNSESVNRIVKDSGAKALIHLAAYTNVSAAHEQDGDVNGMCYQVNVRGTENIASACQQENIYLIHISTDYVFDGTKDSPYTETDEPNPIEWYGKTKWMAEQKVTSIQPKAVILRLAFPYQAHPVRPDFLATMKQKMSDGTLPPQFADHIITPTFVDDVVRVFDYCIQNQPRGVYHMVGSSSHTDYQMAEMVNQFFELKAAVKPGSLTEYLKKVKRPYQQTMRVSNAKLQTEFGLKMSTFAEGLEIIKTQL